LIIAFDEEETLFHQPSDPGTQFFARGLYSILEGLYHRLCFVSQVVELFSKAAVQLSDFVVACHMEIYPVVAEFGIGVCGRMGRRIGRTDGTG
jgi:hypothetical protein